MWLCFEGDVVGRSEERGHKGFIVGQNASDGMNQWRGLPKHL